tara:strand:- start:82 stop:2346 length:2265 start_codon:yes stop_codon:yes gene_type:complete
MTASASRYLSRELTSIQRDLNLKYKNVQIFKMYPYIQDNLIHLLHTDVPTDPANLDKLTLDKKQKDFIKYTRIPEKPQDINKNNNNVIYQLYTQDIQYISTQRDKKDIYIKEFKKETGPADRPEYHSMSKLIIPAPMNTSNSNTIYDDLSEKLKLNGNSAKSVIKIPCLYEYSVTEEKFKENLKIAIKAKLEEDITNYLELYNTSASMSGNPGTGDVSPTITSNYYILYDGADKLHNCYTKQNNKYFNECLEYANKYLAEYVKQYINENLQIRKCSITTKLDRPHTLYGPIDKTLIDTLKDDEYMKFINLEEIDKYIKSKFPYIKKDDILKYNSSLLFRLRMLYLFVLKFKSPTKLEEILLTLEDESSLMPDAFKIKYTKTVIKTDNNDVVIFQRKSKNTTKSYEINGFPFSFKDNINNDNINYNKYYKIKPLNELSVEVEGGDLYLLINKKSFLGIRYGSIYYKPPPKKKFILYKFKSNNNKPIKNKQIKYYDNPSSRSTISNMFIKRHNLLNDDNNQEVFFTYKNLDINYTNLKDYYDETNNDKNASNKNTTNKNTTNKNASQKNSSNKKPKRVTFKNKMKEFFNLSEKQNEKYRKLLIDLISYKTKMKEFYIFCNAKYDDKYIIDDDLEPQSKKFETQKNNIKKIINILFENQSKITIKSKDKNTKYIINKTINDEKISIEGIEVEGPEEGATTIGVDIPITLIKDSASNTINLNNNCTKKKSKLLSLASNQAKKYTRKMSGYVPSRVLIQ